MLWKLCSYIVMHIILLNKVIDQLNAALDVHFPEDEIGFIALHIASNTEDLSMHEMTLINNVIKRYRYH